MGGNYTDVAELSRSRVNHSYLLACGRKVGMGKMEILRSQRVWGVCVD